MFKARNIMIIFALNYLLILLVCCILEIIFISNHAQDAQLLMRTAADMALEQVQATDDFFVTGGGYLLNNEDGYKLTVNTGSKFESVNLFPAFTGISNNKDNVGQMYNKLYGGDKMLNFIKASQSPSSVGPDVSPVYGDVLSLSFVGGAIQELEAATVTVNGTEFTVNPTTSTLYTNWYYIPKLYQMGISDVLNYGSYADSHIKELHTPLGMGDDITYLKNMYELNISEKQAYMEGSSDPISYYLTPISLGVTYINEDLLQALFMNNLDLLMRCKYMQNDDYDLTSRKYGAGVLKGEFYPELVDTESLEEFNPINNGLFTLLRGKAISGTGENAKLYQGTVKPKVEYIVLDMYKDSTKNNEMLRQIFGPRFSNNTEYFDNPSYAQAFRGKTITGQLLQDIDADSIQMLKDITGTDAAVLEHKPIVVAKVTFYADFIIPYSTVSLREMRGREVDGSIGGRLLFDAFSQSTTDGYSALDTNYVELRNITKAADGSAGRSDWDKIYTDEYYDGVSNTNGFYSRLNGNYHSDALCYTTYFAITP